MISMNKKYRTRQGEKVRILATDIDNVVYPIAAEISGCIYQFTNEGYFYPYRGISKSDLVEVSPYKDLKIDDKVIATFDYLDKRKVYFAGLVDGNPTVFLDGRTSFTSIGSIPCLDVVPYTDE